MVSASTWGGPPSGQPTLVVIRTAAASRRRPVNAVRAGHRGSVAVGRDVGLGGGSGQSRVGVPATVPCRVATKAPQAPVSISTPRVMSMTAPTI